jgi:ZIP family zinc transporter
VVPEQFISSLPYIFAATGAGLLGSLVALFWSPNATVRSAIQHFTAGAILAAIATNVIPEVERMGTFAGIISGFIAGGLIMVVLKVITVRLEHGKKQRNKPPLGLAAAAAADTLIDGSITSAGFSTNTQVGALLAFALALELLFLTLSVGVEFREGNFKWWQSLAVTAGISSLFLLGAFGAGFLLEGASEATLAVVLSFGAAALIYLVAEELLVETIEEEKSIFPTGTLFTGFLVLLALKLLSG